MKPKGNSLDATMNASSAAKPKEHTTPSGRPSRQSAGRKPVPPGFVKSNDTIEKGYGSSSSENEISRFSRRSSKKRRPKRQSRRRTPTPPAPPHAPIDEVLSSDDSSSDDDEQEHEENESMSMVFKVPPQHRGPFVVRLDLQQLLEKSSLFGSLPNTAIGIKRPLTPSSIASNQSYFSSMLMKPDQSQSAKRARLSSISLAPTAPSSEIHRKTELEEKESDGSLPVQLRGFNDLPGELRNTIYELVFLAHADLNFERPTNFQRSGQFLRTCRRVHEEGRVFLYSMNSFSLTRCSRIRGAYWDAQWLEVGYKDLRRFLLDIGGANIGLMREIRLFFEDGIPSMNPSTDNNEDLRFVHDPHLIHAVKLLAEHGNLKTLTLSFGGRREFSKRDERFIKNIKMLRADEVNVVPRSIGWGRTSRLDTDMKHYLERKLTRNPKMFDDA